MSKVALVAIVGFLLLSSFIFLNKTIKPYSRILGEDTNKQEDIKRSEDQKKQQEIIFEQQKNVFEQKPELQKEVEKEASRSGTREIEVRGEDGKLEVDFKDATGSAKSFVGKPQSKIHFTANGHEVQIEMDGDKIQIESEGSSASSHLAISLDQKTGKLKAGSQEINFLPADALEKAKAQSHQTQDLGLELEESTATGSADKVEFKVKGVRNGTILGLIPVSYPVETTVGAQTGNILDINEPAWAKLLAFLIR